MKLAQELTQYKSENCVLLALSEGSAVVAGEISKQIHASLYLYMIKRIYLPGEPDAVAALSSTGVFNYNNMLSSGEIAEISSEFQGLIAQERMQKNHDINVLMGKNGAIKKEFFRHKTVIVVSDGMITGFSLEMVADYLKTIAIERLVAVTPIATVQALDKLHLVADEMHYLSTFDGIFKIDHYYEENDVPDIESVIAMMSSISTKWNDTSQEIAPAPAAAAKPQEIEVDLHPGDSR